MKLFDGTGANELEGAGRNGGRAPRRDGSAQRSMVEPDPKCGSGLQRSAPLHGRKTWRPWINVVFNQQAEEAYGGAAGRSGDPSHAAGFQSCFGDPEFKRERGSAVLFVNDFSRFG